MTASHNTIAFRCLSQWDCILVMNIVFCTTEQPEPKLLKGLKNQIKIEIPTTED